jgi:Uncharacterized conserved protein
MRKIIICSAITGSIVSKKNNSNLPITEDEIVAAAYECYCAGASIVHIHVRDDEGNPSLSYYRYQKVIDRIREKCDIVICVSTSNYGLTISDEERYKLYDLNVELVTLTFGSLIRPKGQILNSQMFLEKSLSLLNEKGIRPEFEIFNFDMFQHLKEYYKQRPMMWSPYVQYIFGAPGGMEATLTNITQYIEQTPKTWYWSAAGVGKMQLPTNLLSLEARSTVIRTGLEDNVYFSKGIKAISSAQLVSRLVNIIHDRGMEIATPTETREILQLRKM